MSSNIVTVVKRVVITCIDGDTKTEWFPTHVNIIDSTEFVKLQSRDTGLQRFVGKGFDPTFLDWFKQARTDVSIQLCSGKSELFDKDKHTSTYAMAMKRRRAVEKRTVGDLQDVIEVQVPDLVVNDQLTVSGLTIKCPTCIEKGSAVWVECSPPVMHYVRYALTKPWTMLDKEPAEVDDDPSVNNTSTLRWRSDRKAFLAKRPAADGKWEYKTFRPPSEDKDDVDKARAEAQVWINKPHSSSDGVAGQSSSVSATAEVH
jgi:hypothetical protein